MRLLALVLALAALTAGCPKKPVAGAGEEKPITVKHPGGKPVPPRDAYVFVLILDGGRAQTVYDAIDKGELPNIKQFIVDRGVRVQDAMAVFPSVTTAGHQAYVTGLFPGHSGITGLDWLDRASGRLTDYLSYDVVAIDEDLLNKDNPSHPDELFNRPANLMDDLAPSGVATVYEPFHMGTDDFTPRFPGMRFIYDYAMDDSASMTRIASDALIKIYKRPTDDIPRFVMADFLGHDVCEHHWGFDSKEMLTEMKLEDARIGKIVEAMKESGIWDRAYIVLGADHGQHRTGKYVSLPRILRNAGLRPRGLYAARVNSYTSLIAITSANIYLNKGDWRESVSLDELHAFPLGDGKSVDLIDALLKNPAIEFALVPEAPDRVHIVAAGGKHGVVTRRTWNGVDYFSYATPGSAWDPLRFDEEPGLLHAWVNDGRFHAADDWALASRESKFPDAPLQVMQLFDGDRAGDLVVTAAPGWHFKPRDYVASHGGFGREDMHVPLLISGPDVPHGETIPFARTADIYPTLRRVFGLPVSTSRMDGRPLDEILPWVSAAARVPARHQGSPEADAYFADLAALEAFLDTEDTPGAKARDPGAMFAELKKSDLEDFEGKLDADRIRQAALRRELETARVTLEAEVHSLDRSVKLGGKDGYNDEVWRERTDLKRSSERSFILGRTIERLDARLARTSRLRRTLELVRVAHDVDELQKLFASSRGTTLPN